MRALVVANGEAPPPALLQELAVAADLIVAADGGVDKALAAGLRIDAVVGDLDSASAAARQLLPASAFHQSTALDTTDLEKAVAFCIASGCDAVDIAAAGGGRADHALANLSVLRVFRGQARVTVIDDLFAVSLVEGVETVDAPPGTVVSLVAIGRCTGIATHGLRWDLSGYTLEFSPLGVHNEVARPPATIAVETGDLLLFRGRWIEKHQ
ncbi:MAG: thiamine diphosphokinase [Tepidiformaceae bacterium]